MPKKLLAVPAIALAAGLSLAACGSSGNNSAGSGGNVGNPETASGSQICNSMIGRHVPNVLGEETSTTIVKVVPTAVQGPGTGEYKDRDSSGNPVAYCDFIYSTGQAQRLYISAYPNGSTGFN